MRNLFKLIQKSKYQKSFDVCCVVDNHPRFHVELVLWALCAEKYLLKENTNIIVYSVGPAPQDLVEWLQSHGIELRRTETVVDGSPHCNKIAPFLDPHHDADYIVVCDTDLFFVENPTPLFGSNRFRAPPNNHCNPPPHIFRQILSASDLDRAYRPGLSVCKGEGGTRETHINNICGAMVAAPAEWREAFASTWRKWSRWLVANRELLDRWRVHVDQVAFALTMEEMNQDVEFLPHQVNAILEILEEIDTVYAFHLTTGHIPLYPQRFSSDRTLLDTGVSANVSKAISRLNSSIEDAKEAILSLSSTREHADKFLNPNWTRNAP